MIVVDVSRPALLDPEIRFETIVEHDQGKPVYQQQKQISPNHEQALFPGPAHSLAKEQECYHEYVIIEDRKELCLGQ